MSDKNNEALATIKASEYYMLKRKAKAFDVLKKYLRIVYLEEGFGLISDDITDLDDYNIISSELQRRN